MLIYQLYSGDFNSNANKTGTPTYTIIKNPGFNDAWDIKGNGKGFTCHSGYLLNLNSSLNNKIDNVQR